MFDAFTASAPSEPAPLQQHAGFAEALRAMGRRPLVLDGGAGRPVVVLRRTFAPGIPVAMLARVDLADLAGDGDGFRQWLRLGGLERMPLILAPERPCAAFLRGVGAVPLVSPATVAEIDLRPPEAQRRAALHQKWRNRLVRAEAHPGLAVSVAPFGSNAGRWLLAADRDQQRRRGYRGWPEALTLSFAANNPDQAVQFCARDGSDLVAAMLILRHGAGATYHIGHTTERGRRLSAHNLLMWRAGCWLAARGHRRLDLGLIDTEAAPGLARFKLGAGAQARRLGGTWTWWPPLGRSLSVLALLDRNRE